MTNKVKKVADNNPPITVFAIGDISSEPSPKPNAKGISPKIVVKDVINIGLKRRRLAEISASSIGIPSLSKTLT